MRLYLVQHAKAASEEVDPERALTEQGRRDVQKVAEFIKPLNMSVDYLWHSEKKRAVQTADVLAEVVRINRAKMERTGLGPNDDVAVLKKDLAAGRQDVMIVGHLPFLSKLASLLLTGSESADIVAFKNSGIAALSCEGNRWQINWMVIPELIA